MTIKAILRNGAIQPLEPLPSDWVDGKELIVEEPEPAAPTDAELNAWAREVEVAAAQLPSEEHERFRQALIDNERESKEAVRREWGL